MTTGGKTYLYLTDAIGSVVALADVDGNKADSYAYSPRGVRLPAQLRRRAPGGSDRGRGVCWSS